MGRDSMTEVWRDIKGYEGYYQVSCYGRVRGLLRKDTLGRSVSGRCLKFSIRGGYFRVNLSKNNVLRKYSVHKLVALTFIPNT